eukprot:scaffold29230_cov55-Phaeocystis_antarctica.AAC.4
MPASASAACCSRPELASAAAKGALFSSALSTEARTHRDRSSAASTGLRKPSWRSRLAPFCSSAPKPPAEAYTPSKPVELCDDRASTSSSTPMSCVAPCAASH